MRPVLKLITFDITDTLKVFRIPVPIMYSETAKRFGINVNSSDLIPSLKAQFRVLSRDHPNYGKSTGLGWNAWWTELVTGTFKSLEPGCDDRQLKKLAQYLIEEFKTTRCWDLADGAIEILDFLKTKNVPIGVISNNDDRLETILKNLRLYPYFDFVITSYAANVMKPQKIIFDMARQKVASNLDPCKCMHVGNNIDLDYMGAKRAGWKSVYVGPIDEAVLSVVDEGDMFPNLIDLQQYFAKEFIFQGKE